MQTLSSACNRQLAASLAQYIQIMSVLIILASTTFCIPVAIISHTIERMASQTV